MGLTGLGVVLVALGMLLGIVGGWNLSNCLKRRGAHPMASWFFVEIAVGTVVGGLAMAGIGVYLLFR